MERIVTSRKRVKVRKEVGWYSENELKTDLHWSTWLCCSTVLSVVLKLHHFAHYHSLMSLMLQLLHSSIPLRSRINAVKTHCADPARAATHSRPGPLLWPSQWYNFHPWHFKEKPLRRLDGILGHRAGKWCLWRRARNWREETIYFQGLLLLTCGKLISHTKPLLNHV